jgi:hypothetical protein
MDGETRDPSAGEETQTALRPAGTRPLTDAPAETCAAPPGEAAGRIVRCARVPADHPEAAAALARALGPDLAQVLLFASPRSDFRRLAAGAAAFGPAALAACTTAGEIMRGYVEDDIVALGLPRSHFAVESVTVPDLDAIDGPALIAVMIRARQALAAARPDWPHEFAFLMVDGTSLREDALMEALSQGLGPVPLFGGSAGDGTRFHQSLLAQGGAVMLNAAILLFVRTICPVKVFSLDHLDPGTDRMVVTGADPARRLVREINAEPAAREYARLLGKDPDQLDPFTFAAHPLVVRVGGRYYVRSIQRVTDEGHLVFYSAIDEGVVLTLATPRDMAAALDADLSAIAAAGPLDTVLACDCILRRIEARQKQRSLAVSDVLRRHRVIGFSTYGEQFGAMHVNLTMTGVAIFRPEAEPGAR